MSKNFVCQAKIFENVKVPSSSCFMCGNKTNLVEGYVLDNKKPVLVHFYCRECGFEQKNE